MEINLTANITTFIAIWGAFLSTIVAIRGYLKDKVKIKVQVKRGFIHNLPEEQLFIKAINKGRVPVLLSSYGIRLEDGNFLFSPDTTLPLELPKKIEYGEACTIMLDLASFLERAYEKNYKLKYAYFMDNLDKEYKSSSKEFKKLLESNLKQ